MESHFWLGTTIKDLWFKGLSTSTTTGFVLVCIGLWALAITFERIKVEHMLVRHQTLAVESSENVSASGENAMLVQQSKTTVQCHRWITSLKQLFWFSLQDIVAYFVMLSVMTFNGYFLISVALGTGIGYLLFSPLLVELSLKNAKKKKYVKNCPQCTEKMLHDQEKSNLVEVAQGVAHFISDPSLTSEISHNDDSSNIAKCEESDTGVCEDSSKSVVELTAESQNKELNKNDHSNSVVDTPVRVDVHNTNECSIVV